MSNEDQIRELKRENDELESVVDRYRRRVAAAERELSEKDQRIMDLRALVSDHVTHAGILDRTMCALGDKLSASKERVKVLEAALRAYIEQTCGGVNPHPSGTNSHRVFELCRTALAPTPENAP